MTDLPTLITQLNNCKLQLNALIADSSSCICMSRDQILNGLVDLNNTTLTVQSIENVINNVPTDCTYCVNVDNLKCQLEDLKSKVYDQINVNYSLTKENNPFLI